MTVAVSRPLAKPRLAAGFLVPAARGAPTFGLDGPPGARLVVTLSGFARWPIPRRPHP